MRQHFRKHVSQSSAQNKSGKKISNISGEKRRTRMSLPPVTLSFIVEQFLSADFTLWPSQKLSTVYVFSSPEKYSISIQNEF